MNKNTFRGKAKDQWGHPGKDRLDMIAAKRDQLENEIQQAFSIIKAVARNEGREFKEVNKF